MLLLAGLAVLAPVRLGFYLERMFDAALDRLEREMPLIVTCRRFYRGWFGSHARFRIAPAPPWCAQPPCAGTGFETRLYRGPLALGAPAAESSGATSHGWPMLAVCVTRVDLATLWPRWLFEPALPPLRMVTRIGLDTVARSTF